MALISSTLGSTLDGVTRNLDLSALIGLCVQQVALGKHQLQIKLSDSGSIHVDSSVELYDASGNLLESWRSDVHLESTALVSLLGREIVATAVHPPRRLDIVFDGGLTMRLIESQNSFESFQIEPGGIIV